MNHDNDDNDNDEKFTLGPQERGRDFIGKWKEPVFFSDL